VGVRECGHRQYSGAVHRRADIEGLRAVAVLAVLLFHAGVPWFEGGYVGVDVFFVVSGYLITGILLRERSESGGISLAGFWSRRARRILPMSALVAVATLVASWIWLEPTRVRDAATDAIGVATFSANLVLADRGADYLQSELPPSPFQHYWSLAVEEQFYLVWPLLVVLVCLGATGASAVRRRIGLLAATVTAASFAACMVLMESSQPWAFFAPHTRAFELSLGALVAAVPSVAGARDRMVSAVVAWAGLAVVVASAVLFDETTRFPGPWAIVPVVATALLLRGGEAMRWSPVVILRAAPLQWLGSRSYSAYMWHWPVLVVGAAALGRDPTITEGLTFTAGALVLSELSWRWPEETVRRATVLRGVRAAMFAAALVSLVAGAGVLVRNNPPTVPTAGEADAPVLAGTPTSATVPGSSISDSIPSVPSPMATTQTVPTPPTLPGPSAPIGAVVAAASTTGLPSNLEPNLNNVRNDMPRIYSNGCHVWFGATVPKRCVVGDENSDVVVGVYGDSHAAQWFPMFEKIAIKRKWRLIYYTKRGCPPARIEVYSSVLGKVYRECGPWRENVLRRMESDGVKVVFVAHFDRLLSATTKTPPWQKEWRAGLQATLDELESRGIVPVLMEDTPWPGQDVPTCLSRNFASVDDCSQPVSQAYRDDMREVRADFQAAGANVLWVRQWFCTATVCPNIAGNILMYRDNNHITVTYASFIAPLVDAVVADFVDWHAQSR